MQVGTLSLMQLAKTMAALERLRAAGVPFISVMSDPTTGGVFASYAAMGDVNLAEPNALIGFAGARVSAGTIAAELPPGFQRAEFLFEHGFIDRVVARPQLRAELAALLAFLVPSDREAAQMEAFDAAAFIFRPITVPLSMLSRVVDRVLPEEPAGASPDAPAAAPPAAESSDAPFAVPALAARATEPAGAPVAELAAPGIERPEGSDRG
jgi:acetyl-CoA carboxylase carboxyl transferase subunit beta